ncbi:MAG: carbohydrate kinase family protein [Candidatus Bathyarchaeota archaeon]|nr:carbohydrate kinase family protein [Candidatus Bathyarchaeota archaeon]
MRPVMLAGCKNELLRFLKEEPERLEVVVLPDFFLDRIVSLDCDMARFSSMIAEVAYRKGGSIDGISQNDIRGGNAINTASALATLGAEVTPIVCADKLGLQQIKFHLGRYGVDFSHVKIVEKASVTTALELKTKSGTVNVMLRDVGSLAEFGPSSLTDSDYAVIENADYVCVFNWAGTKKFGTKLAEDVFRRAKTKGKGKTYCDTADPAPNIAEIPELMEKVIKSKQLDVLSLNENEAVTYAALLSSEISEQRGRLPLEELAEKAAQVLAQQLSARIDLHTTSFSATFDRKHEVKVPAFKVEALRATGAGDAWNAGNILGDAGGLSHECRLALANAVSACYLSDPSGMHPTRQKLARFIERAL